MTNMRLGSTVNSAAQPRSAKNGLKRTTPTCTANCIRKVRRIPRLPCPRPSTQDLKGSQSTKPPPAEAASAEARRAEELASSKILIKRIERNKRKYVTAVQGLEAFGLDIKKVAKDFGKKFATGSSVTKIPGGGEEITVQGDLSEDILEFLVDKYEEVPEDNVELIEDKKKKKAEGG
jgi:density-regulated protein DRP1